MSTIPCPRDLMGSATSVRRYNSKYDPLPSTSFIFHYAYELTTKQPTSFSSPPQYGFTAWKGGEARKNNNEAIHAKQKTRPLYIHINRYFELKNIIKQLRASQYYMYRAMMPPASDAPSPVLRGEIHLAIILASFARSPAKTLEDLENLHIRSSLHLTIFYGTRQCLPAYVYSYL